MKCFVQIKSHTTYVVYCLYCRAKYCLFFISTEILSCKWRIPLISTDAGISSSKFGWWDDLASPKSSWQSVPWHDNVAYIWRFPQEGERGHGGFVLYGWIEEAYDSCAAEHGRGYVSDLYLGICHQREFLNSVCCYGYWFFVSVVNFGMMGRRVCLTRGWCQMRVLFKINLIFFFLSASFCCAGLLTRYFCHGGASILDCSFQSDFDHAQRQCRCKNEERSFCSYDCYGPHNLAEQTRGAGQTCQLCPCINPKAF